MRYSDFENSEDDSEDVLVRIKHENGTTVTFLTAPASLFAEQEELEPMVYGICESEVCIAFNEDVIERMIKDSIIKNGEIYGAHAASLLPVTMILNLGCAAASKYIKENEGSQGL